MVKAFAIMIAGSTAVSTPSPAALPSSKPFTLDYDARKAAPSAMQEVRGILAVEKGCVVLKSANWGTLMLVWRRPMTLRDSNGGLLVKQMGVYARMGQAITLTGTGGRWKSYEYARQRGVPAACRAFATFAVNGILSGSINH